MSSTWASVPRADRSGGQMALFILKRIGLGLITLWILSVIIFFAGSLSITLPHHFCNEFVDTNLLRRGVDFISQK